MTFQHTKRLRVAAAVGLAIVVGLSFVVTGDNAVTRADASTVRWIAEHRTTAVVHVAEAVTDLGNFGVLAVLTLVFWVAVRFGWPRTPLPWLPALALAVAAIIDPLAKLAVGRPRPPHDLAVMIEQATGYPSGHSAQSAATWIAFALVVGGAGPHRSRWLAVAIAVTGFVGVSRVVLGVHSPTDVIGGWALGVACVALLFSAFVRRPHNAAIRSVE